MKTFNPFTLVALIIIANQTVAQEPYGNKRNIWLQTAAATQPTLVTTEKRPLHIVTITKDENSFQGFKVNNKKFIDSFYVASMKSQSGIILDFGEHLTGFVTFRIEDLKGVADAALRLKFTFAEVPAEAMLPFDPYKGGLSRAWLQDEIVTVSEVPSTLTIPRRVAFRYVKIEVLGSSTYSDFKISDISLKATTSAVKQPPALAAGTSELIKKIDQVGLNTLKECMQTVYEDGPKRDRRLWIGDLYLESLANRYSFKNDSLTKHCLYLLAGLSYPTGVAPSNVFERPSPHAQYNPLFDYALIYNTVLKEYLIETGDTATAIDLWDVAKVQIQLPKKYIRDDGMMDYELAGKEWWVFFDWKDGLDKQTALQGCVIWAFKNTYELARMLGKEKEVSELPALADKMIKAAHKNLYDSKQGLFTSGKSKQISYASQAWMVLSGVASKSEGAKAFKNLLQKPDVVYPGAPYLYHYVIEAMIAAGLNQEAKTILTKYWGGMIEKGADTFWEVYDPKNDFISPYNSFLVNSYCHAWSCTPVYFIRKYPLIFQVATKEDKL
ncbi:MAG: glycoside hydrolase [Chitinophagaceae bacterium]|nr:MAG: glycoside hydrolase [Chitinophagaceae bacterium]